MMHKSEDHVISYVEMNYPFFSRVPVSYLDLANKKLPAVCCIPGSTNITVINIWRDLYVYGWFSNIRHCHFMRQMPTDKEVYMLLRTRRRSKERPGVSVAVLSMCGCGDICHIKSNTMYAIIQVTRLQPYVLSFDTFVMKIYTKIYWGDYKCICEPLLNVVSGALFSWAHYNRENTFGEEVIRGWMDMDAFRMCNAKILKRVSADEMIHEILKARGQQ